MKPKPEWSGWARIGHRIIHTFRLSAHKTKQRLPFGPSALLSSRIRKGSVTIRTQKQRTRRFESKIQALGLSRRGDTGFIERTGDVGGLARVWKSRLCQYVCNSLASSLRVSPFPIKGGLTRACSAVRSARLP